MSEENFLCTNQDSFLEDKAIWVATLSNGITIYQDDERPGIEEPIAWKRMRTYCAEEGVGIEFLRLKFRSNVVPITPKKNVPDKYYFAYGVTKDIVATEHHEYYLCGFCLGESLHYSWYKIPEMIKRNTNTTKIPDNADKDERFILNIG